METGLNLTYVRSCCVINQNYCNSFNKIVITRYHLIMQSMTTCYYIVNKALQCISQLHLHQIHAQTSICTHRRLIQYVDCVLCAGLRHQRWQRWKHDNSQQDEYCGTMTLSTRSSRQTSPAPIAWKLIRPGAHPFPAKNPATHPKHQHSPTTTTTTTIHSCVAYIPALTCPGLAKLWADLEIGSTTM